MRRGNGRSVMKIPPCHVCHVACHVYPRVIFFLQMDTSIFCPSLGPSWAPFAMCLTVPGPTRRRKKRETPPGAENRGQRGPVVPPAQRQEKGIVLTHIMVKGKTGPGGHGRVEAQHEAFFFIFVLFLLLKSGVRRTHGRDIWV